MKRSHLSACTAIILLLISLCVGESCFARIGETEEQTEARLGKATSSKETDPDIPSDCLEKVYHKNAYNITVIFYQGVSQCEIYSKDGGDGGRMSEIEKNAILQNNALNGTWTESLRDEDIQGWSWSGANKMEAFYSQKGETPPILSIETIRFKDHARISREAKEKQDAGGL